MTVRRPTERVLKELKFAIQSSLDECRMLVLAGQVMLAFSYESVFQSGFRDLSPTARALCAGAMILLTSGLILLMSVSGYHQITCRGEEDPRLCRYTNRVLCVALGVWALSLGASMYVVGERAGGVVAACAAGAAGTVISLAAWYAFPAAAHRHAPPEEPDMDTNELEKDLGEKIRHVLTEARIVLPGAQAMLGAALLGSLTDAFEAMPPHLKSIHLFMLASIAITTVLLMTPAAYHRIVLHGAKSDAFHRIASRLLLAAMATLALGFGAGVWVVIEKVTRSVGAGAACGAGMVLIAYGLWFGWTLARRTPLGR